MSENIKQIMTMPGAEPSGFIPTLNRMGYMTSSLDPVSREFVQFAAKGNGPVLEVGAAYGVAAMEALQAGATVFANDIDPRHLEILRERVPNEMRARLNLLPGAFPDDIELKPESLDAILICRVLHFFRGPEILRALQKSIRWLKPNGKIFIINETPFLKNFSGFLSSYKANQVAGHPWPGLVENPSSIAGERGKLLPSFIHLLDAEIMERLLKESGFEVEKIEYLNRIDFPADMRLDGRESVAAVGMKPK